MSKQDMYLLMTSDSQDTKTKNPKSLEYSNCLRVSKDSTEGEAPTIRQPSNGMVQMRDTLGPANLGNWHLKCPSFRTFFPLECLFLDVLSKRRKHGLLNSVLLSVVIT